MLDVGCGTAEHLRFLVGYQMVGLDIDPTFIRLAKRKLPSAEFYVGDMRQFQLGLKFDVILCLFSSIGYLLQRHELRPAQPGTMVRFVSERGLRSRIFVRGINSARSLCCAGLREHQVTGRATTA